MGPEIAAQQHSSKQLYAEAVETLQRLAAEPGRLENHSDEAVFLDDIRLQLKLWAADVGEQSIDWADNIEPVKAELVPLLEAVNQAIPFFETPSKGSAGLTPKEPIPETSDSKLNSKRGRLSNAVDNLTSYTLPLKAVGSIPESKRTEEHYIEMNRSFSNRRRTGLFSTWTVLDRADLNLDEPEKLLGAIVLNPQDPLHQRITPDDSLRKTVNKVVAENFTFIPTHSVSADAEASISVADAGVKASISSIKSSRESFGPTTLTRYSLENSRLFILEMLDQHKDVLGKSDPWKKGSFYAVVGLVTMEEQRRLFAIQYTKISYRRKFPWSSREFEVEKNNGE